MSAKQKDSTNYKQLTNSASPSFQRSIANSIYSPVTSISFMAAPKEDPKGDGHKKYD